MEACVYYPCVGNVETEHSPRLASCQPVSPRPLRDPVSNKTGGQCLKYGGQGCPLASMLHMYVTPAYEPAHT